jgi:nucleotide-binding universal stress UspA family protein
VPVGQFEIGRDGPSLVVAAVDGSPTSLRAGAYAAGLARRQRSVLVVAHVITTPALLGVAGATTIGAVSAVDETLDEVAEDLRRQVETESSRIGLEARFRAERGDAYTELVRIADDERADLVVVGASSRAGHRLVGSIAVRLVRAGRWPVTVVP